MAYIGNEVTQSTFTSVEYTATAAQTTFPASGVLPETAPNQAAAIVKVNGLVSHTDSYAIGTTLVFDSPGLDAGDKVEIVWLGLAGSVTVPADNTVTNAKIARAGTSGQVLTSAGTGADVTWATPSTNFSSYAIFQDEKASGTAGGAFTSGAWRTRDLNTTVANTDTTNITLGTNQFTLLTGSYLIRWGAIAYEVLNHQSRLYDVTGTAAVDYGSTDRMSTNGETQTTSAGSARVTVAASPGTNIFSIEHRCDTTNADGFGKSNSYGNVQVYVTVEIFKEA